MRARSTRSSVLKISSPSYESLLCSHDNRHAHHCGDCHLCIPMKVTRAYAEESAKEKGYEPIQVDGIPEGFSFKKPDIDIGGKVHVGELIAFIPLAETERAPGS